VQAVIDWLVSLPVVALYFALAAVAAAENFFPPLPADTVVALGSFLAAQGQGSAIMAFLATWVGNVSGAMVMYVLGRKYGAERLERRLIGDKGPGAQAKLQTLYGRYGVLALFASRFIPGVRAVVPPFAGALRVPPVSATIAIAGASAVWYGVVSYLGFTVGGNWPRLSQMIYGYGKMFAIGAASLAAVGALILWIRQRKRRAS
jgi:membrane protein DedA with SNARE-associated domain